MQRWAVPILDLLPLSFVFLRGILCSSSALRSAMTKSELIGPLGAVWWERQEDVSIESVKSNTWILFRFVTVLRLDKEESKKKSFCSSTWWSSTTMASYDISQALTGEMFAMFHRSCSFNHRSHFQNDFLLIFLPTWSWELPNRNDVSSADWKHDHDNYRALYARWQRSCIMYVA